jgi:hypothetical protein
MNGGNSGTNGSDLDKSNILKPTFDTLTEEDRNEFEVYHANLEELFLSRCDVTQHGTVIKDTTLIVFHKPEVIPEVRPDPSSPHNDIQSMINSALERQAKSTDELLRRLIEERDRKNSMLLVLTVLLILALLVLLKLNHTQVVHRRTTMLNPSAQPMNHFHSRTTIEGSASTFGAL